MGVDVGSQQCSVVTIDFAGQTLRKNRRDFGQAMKMETLRHQVELFVNEHVTALTARQRKNLKGLGITFPGCSTEPMEKLLAASISPTVSTFRLSNNCSSDLDCRCFWKKRPLHGSRGTLVRPAGHPEDFIVVDIGYGVAWELSSGEGFFAG
jgi:hypothetical protein